MYRMCSLMFLLAGPGDASPLPSADLPSYGGLLLKTILALVIVIALAYALLRWGLKRLMPGHAAGGGEISILDRQPLDSRRQVVLVKAYGRYLLLGVGDGSVTLLTELEADAVAEAERRRAAQPPRRFADVLRATLGRDKPIPEPITPSPDTDTDDRPQDTAGADKDGSDA
jgi:flagellar biosynthetic protein FliO